MIFSNFMETDLEKQAKQIVLNRITADLMSGKLHLGQFQSLETADKYPKFEHKSDLNYSLEVMDLGQEEPILDLFVSWDGEDYFFDIDKGKESGPAVEFLNNLAEKINKFRQEWREADDKKRLGKLISGF